MKFKLFYSWQSDLPNKDNRSFIEDVLKKSIKAKKNNYSLFEIDRDTKGLLGSPDINEAIFNKIDDTDIFVCDISIINNSYHGRKVPNPNVLIELGYAARSLGWDKIICLYNTKYGTIDDFPFDLKTKRLLQYDSDKTDEKKKLVKLFSNVIIEMHNNQKLFNPIKDHIKGKIDYCYLEFLKHLAVFVYGKFGMSESLGNVSILLNSKGDYKDEITNQKIPGFFIFKSFEEIDHRLDDLFQNVNSSTNYPKEWSVYILKLRDLIRSYSWYLSHRRKINLYNKYESLSSDFTQMSAYDINNNNSKNSFLFTKVNNEGSHVVINSGIMSGNYSKNLDYYYKITDSEVDSFCTFIDSVIELSNNWLEDSGDEFVLDPEYYHIGGKI